MDNIRKYIKIGTTVDSRFGVAKVTGIEMVEEGRKDGGIEMEKIFYADKDRCVFDLDNGHWQYGYQISVSQGLTSRNRRAIV